MNILKNFFYLFLASGLSCLLACTGHSNHSSDSTPPSIVTFDGITYEFQSNQLTREQTGLIQILKSGTNEATANAMISAFTISQHSQAAQKTISTDDITKFIASVVDGIQTSDPFDLKLAIEAELSKKFSPDPLKYNKAMISIGDIIGQNQMQCFSGSTIYSVAALDLKAFLASQKPAVLIYRPGHVLPGFVGPSQDGTSHLYGIETTVSGRGEIDFGSTEKTLPENIVVVQTRDSLIAGVLKTSLVNVDQLRRSVIEKSSRNLGLKYAKDVLSLYATVDNNEMKKTFNASIFSFGHLDIPDGPMDRQNADQLPVDTLLNYQSNPTVAISSFDTPPAKEKKAEQPSESDPRKSRKYLETTEILKAENRFSREAVNDWETDLEKSQVQLAICDWYEQNISLYALAFYGCSDSVKRLSDSIGLSEKDNSVLVSLFWGQKYFHFYNKTKAGNTSDDVEMTKFLIQKGADVNKTVLERDDYGVLSHEHYGCYTTPLTSVQNVEDARILIDAGADVSRAVQCEGVGTPLEHAVEENNPELVKLLIDRGANINLGFSRMACAWEDNRLCDLGYTFRYQYYTTALHLARRQLKWNSEETHDREAIANDKAIVDYLLDRGAKDLFFRK